MAEQTPESSKSILSYVLGGVIVVAVIVGGYFLRPKSTTPPAGEQPAVTAETPTPTSGPITKLVCDTQYYNPVRGFAKYYLSVEGGDTEGASEVTCTTKVTQENKVVATEEVSTPLSPNTTRGGLVFKCTTPALDLKPEIPTKVDVTITDDKDASTSCSRTFALPKP